MEKIIKSAYVLNNEGEMVLTDVRIKGDRITEIGTDLNVGNAEIIKRGGLVARTWIHRCPCPFARTWRRT